MSRRWRVGCCAALAAFHALSAFEPLSGSRDCCVVKLGKVAMQQSESTIESLNCCNSTYMAGKSCGGRVKLFGCLLVSYTARVGFLAPRQRLHKAQEAAEETSVGTGRTRSANPGRPPEATAAGATRVSSARDGAGGSRGAIAASCLGIVISSLLRAKSERVIFRSSGSGVGAELLDSSMERGIIPQSREIS